MGKYDLTDDGVPLNPMGRTGISERGDLYLWGPNQAVDPIVTRWARKGDNVPGEPWKNPEPQDEKDEAGPPAVGKAEKDCKIEVLDSIGIKREALVKEIKGGKMLVSYKGFRDT